MAQVQVPFPRLAQVGFPIRFHAVEQLADHVLAEEPDQVGGYAAFEVQGRAVLGDLSVAVLGCRLQVWIIPLRLGLDEMGGGDSLVRLATLLSIRGGPRGGPWRREARGCS